MFTHFCTTRAENAFIKLQVQMSRKSQSAKGVDAEEERCWLGSQRAASVSLGPLGAAGGRHARFSKFLVLLFEIGPSSYGPFAGRRKAPWTASK
jgi:hypothetical protein